jgi:hypothetical protein
MSKLQAPARRLYGWLGVRLVPNLPMVRTLICLFLLACLLQPFLPALAAKDKSVRKAASLRVLFVGNSFTWDRNIPALFAALAGSDGSARKVEVSQVCFWNYSLDDHRLNGTAAKEISKDGPWDFVVLQDQSGRAFANPAAVEKSVGFFVSMVRKSGARPVLFMTWVDKDNLAGQNKVSDVYRRLGKKFDCQVAPVGDVWKSALAGERGISLHGQDGHHAGDQGSYLTACVFYAVMLGKSPVGLPNFLNDPTCQQYLLSLSPDLASRLQKLAWREVKDRAAPNR